MNKKQPKLHSQRSWLLSYVIAALAVVVIFYLALWVLARSFHGQNMMEGYTF